MVIIGRYRQGSDKENVIIKVSLWVWISSMCCFEKEI